MSAISMFLNEIKLIIYCTKRIIYIYIYFIEKILENSSFKIKFKGYFMMYKHTFMYTCFGNIDKREKRGSNFCSIA